MAGKCSNGAFLFGKLPLRQTRLAQAVEETIADFFNPVSIDSREILNSELGYNFQHRRLGFAVESSQCGFVGPILINSLVQLRPAFMSVVSK